MNRARFESLGRRLGGSRVWLAVALVVGGGAVTEEARAGVTLELVVDGSGSMWSQLGGLPKTIVVREGLKPVLDRMQRQDVQVGVTVFGTLANNGCDNVDVLVKPGAVDAVDLPALIGAMSPRGMSTLVQAVKKAGSELEVADGKRLIVVVADGDDACLPNACEVLRAWREKGGPTVNILGLAIAEPEAEQQLTCLAQAGGGAYVNVTTIKGIEDTVRGWVEKAVSADREERLAAERARAEAERIRQATHVKVVLRTSLPPAYCSDVEVSRADLDGHPLELPPALAKLPCRGQATLYDSISDPGNHALKVAYIKRSRSGDVATSETVEVPLPLAPAQTTTVELEARAGWLEYKLIPKVSTTSTGSPALAGSPATNRGIAR